MIGLDVRSNIKDVVRGLDNFQRKQIPYAVSLAINDVSFDVMRAEKQQLDKRLDRPTPFTKSGVRVKKATKRQLAAVVYFQQQRNEYMKTIVYGGTRRPANRSLLIPTKNTKLNKYGNITRATRKRMFADKVKFFSGVPRGHPGAGAGIWERYGSKGGRYQKIRMVALYKGKAQYSPLFPFGEIAGKVVVGKFNKHFANRMARALATAK